MWTRDSERTSPFASPGFFDAWCDAFSSTRTGFVVAGFTGDTPRIVLPLWYGSERDTWFSLGEFRADYSEAVGDDAACDELWSWLQREAPCRLLKIGRVPRDTAFGRTAPPVGGIRERIREAATSFVRERRVRYHETHELQEHPYTDRARLAELAARIDSKDTKRKINVLRREGELVYEVVRGAEIAARLPAFFALHRASFAGTQRTSQFERADECRFYEALVARLAETVTLDVLRVGERPVAMHFGFQHAKTIYWYKPVFDLELSKGSPGRVMLAHLYARALRENVDRVDLLKGDETYKDDWAANVRITVTSTIVERSVRDVLAGLERRLRGAR